MASGRALATSLVALLIVSGCAGPATTPASSLAASSPEAPEPTTTTASPGSAAPSVAPPPAAPCAAPPNESTEVRWAIDGSERSTLVHPPETAGTSPAPLVIALHGYGGFGMELERISELSDAADERGWIVVYPEGVGQPQAWGYDPAQLGHAADIAFLRTLVDDMVEAGCVDAERVVVTGISQGGWLADMAGCEMSDVVAGVVSVASRDFGWPCEPASPVPFAAVSGVLDDVLPWEGGPINAPPPITSVGSVDDWLAERATLRSCSGAPEETRTSPHVVRFEWSGCTAPVALYRVEDGGHSWPSGGGFPPVNHELSVTEIIAGMVDTTT